MFIWDAIRQAFTWTWTLAVHYWWAALALAVALAAAVAWQSWRARRQAARRRPPAEGWREDPGIPRFGAGDNDN